MMTITTINIVTSSMISTIKIRLQPWSPPPTKKLQQWPLLPMVVHLWKREKIEKSHTEVILLSRFVYEPATLHIALVSDHLAIFFLYVVWMQCFSHLKLKSATKELLGQGIEKTKLESEKFISLLRVMWHLERRSLLLWNVNLSVSITIQS